MKTVGRLDSKETGTTAVYLSDGNMNMALVKNSPIAKRGVQLLGIKVPSIKDVGERLKQSAEYLYPGEAPITLRERPASSPYKTVYFRIPMATRSMFLKKVGTYNRDGSTEENN